MVAVSVQGVKETLSGMHYSAPVKSVFIGKLLLIEILLLISASFMMPKWISKKKMLFALMFVIFLFTAVFRLTYDFPMLHERLVVWLGDWVRL